MQAENEVKINHTEKKRLIEQETSYNSFDCLELGLWVGYGLMANGAETVRVEDSVTRILHAYELIEAEVIAMSNYIIVSARSLSGVPLNLSKRMHNGTSNLDKVDRLNALARRICDEKPDPKETLEQVHDILNEAGYPFKVQCLAVPLSAFAFCLLIGSSLVPALWAMANSLIMLILMRPIKNYYKNPLLSNIIGSIFITLFSWPVKYTIYSNQLLLMMTGSFMYFFPGIALINSTRDLMAGDYGAGWSKMVEAFLLAISVAIGSGVTLAVLRQLWPIG